MKIPIYQIDAFTSEVFHGNPAAVCPIERWLEPETMLAIAAENNLSETAFLVAQPGGYALRWFTPKHEVRLCGHATLASAFLVFDTLDPSANSVQFESCSGPLRVKRDGDWMAMDFPAMPIVPREPAPQYLMEGMNPRPRIVLQSVNDAPEGNFFVVYETEEDVRNAQPDLSRIERLHPSGVGVTAPGDDCDFVSRYFAPSFGIPEDPVTGSTHCSLGPYWAERLKKTSLHAKQLSSRGGELLVEPRGDRVILKGKAVMYMKGTISL